MKLPDAVNAFDDWSTPWTFFESVRLKLTSDPDEVKQLEAVFAEASRREHWQEVELAAGCEVAHRETRKKFPHLDDGVIAALIRAASYDWR